MLCFASLFKYIPFSCKNNWDKSNKKQNSNYMLLVFDEAVKIHKIYKKGAKWKSTSNERLCTITL